MVLADLGANVIKVEQPGSGDIARNAGAIYLGDESAIFLTFNRGKRSLAIDLSKEEGRAAFFEVAKTADVFLENYRPGTSKRLGIDYGSLRSLNPRLVYASITAFGSDGPYVNRPANDPIIQAMSGAMAITGDQDRPPARQGVSVPDFGTGMMAATGIIAALFGRATTGEGAYLEYNLLDVEIFALGPRAQEFLLNGEEQPRLGSAHPQFAPYQAYLCSDDSYVYVAVINEKFWRGLCKAIERPDLLSDPRFENNRQRCLMRDELNTILAPLLRERSQAEVLALLDEHGVPAGPVYAMNQVFDDPQVVHNEVVLEVNHPTVGQIKSLASPFVVDGVRSSSLVPPPLLGQHSREILIDAGVVESSVDHLIREGIVQQSGEQPASHVNQEA